MTYDDLMAWAPEKQLLAQETPNYEDRQGALRYDRRHRYSIERELTESESIEFISLHDEFFKPTLDLADLFQKEKETIKRDKYGYKTVSLIAWVKRNNGTRYVDTDYEYGKLYGYSTWGNTKYITTIGEPDKREKFIKERLSITLDDLRAKEFEYFKDNDEYTILKRKLHKEQISYFGVQLCWCSDGRAFIRGEDGRERNITIDEIKQLLAMNQQVKNLITKLTNECDIKY